MKKLIGLAVAAVCLSFLLSCDDTETYADKLKRERAAISRFIDTSGIKIIHEYPEGRLFEANEFFLDPESGVYFHVIDSGNGRRATAGRKIYVRYSNTGSFISSSSFSDTNESSGLEQDYLNFTYGNTTTYTDNSYSNTYSNYAYKSAGVVAPLSYVGDSAIIKLIVPFKVGSGLQQTSYEPVYFGRLFYDFLKEQGE
ncbi:MAG: DUF4827 domain-containing protein [Prevotella sp.]|jgi:hypothetical protein|nr:DUF4827 domain-containing protein [Prevotella sp.]